jgi:hypothetical protein
MARREEAAKAAEEAAERSAAARAAAVGDAGGDAAGGGAGAANAAERALRTLVEADAFELAAVCDLHGRLLAAQLPPGGTAVAGGAPVRLTGMDGALQVGELCSLSRMFRSKRPMFRLGQAEFGQVQRTGGHTVRGATKDGRLRCVAVRAPPRMLVGVVCVEHGPEREKRGRAALEALRA